MTIAEFINKWSRFTGKEASAYQDHFSDLCRVLAHATPIAADPTGNDTFCFQKRVVKDAELFDTADLFNTYAANDDERHAATRGFADVWLKDHFAWEYKGPGGDLEDAYLQLLRYRESLLNPPLLVVCDFHRFIIRTNFNGTVQQTYDIPLAKMDHPENLRVLRAVFSDPDSLRPERTTKQVTEQLAKRIGDVARSLQDRASIELTDTRTRKEIRVAEKRNLRIAQFLNRLTFCFFAEDVGLLPKRIFADIAAEHSDDPAFFTERLEALFRVMSVGGAFGNYRIRHFNGHLFEDVTVFELTREEIAALSDAADADWQFIDPTIFGTLFQRALEKEHRAQLGAHYTSPEDIKTLLEPVLMAPLRQEWTEIKRTLRQEYRIGKAPPAARKTLEAFLKRLRETVVLDPACGSGNFLYLALQLLLDLEKDVIAFAARMGRDYTPEVDVHQLRAIEINPYAFELAQVSVQIGYLQWRRDNGFPLDQTPVLRTLKGFDQEDALMREMFGRKRTNLKDAQAAEHVTDTGVKAYTERNWPECSVIVGNPPFLGNKRMRAELGVDYAKWIFEIFGDRLPATSDFCCYWFEKARAHIQEGHCERAGLLATTGSKQVSSRRALERIGETGRIFFAISDRDWWDAGTAVRICMVGFAGPDVTDATTLDGRQVERIHSDLTAGADMTGKRYLAANRGKCFMGTTKVGDFDLPAETAIAWLQAPNPHGRPNSDVLRPFRNGSDIVRRNEDRWIVDFGVGTAESDAALYEAPFAYVVANVKPERTKNNRAIRARNWWLLGETLPAFRHAIAPLTRYLATARVAKHRLFVWLDSATLPDSKVIAIAFDDDLHMGLLQSRAHELWTLATCGWHGIGKDATYNPTECFETFTFPTPTPAQEGAITAAAKELNALRENWLNPPDWTREEILEFPGTVGGPWSRYILNPEPRTLKPGAIAPVRYPRLVPRDPTCAARLKDRTLTKLYNERPAWLADAHRRLDLAVSTAYAWSAELTDDQILERLLTMNAERTGNRTA